MKTRQTRQKEILQAIIDKQTHFFGAEDIYEKAKNDQISLATIYRFLKEQEKNNELYMYRCEGRSIYSKHKKSHCHFICEETGKVIHFDIDSLDFLKNKIPGDINSFHIEVRGICKKCK